MSESVRFTQAALHKLAARDRRYVVFHPTLPAFGLRVEPSGTKTFQLSYRVGRRLRMARLGTFAKPNAKPGDEIVTLDQAERAAKRMLGLVADGKDPLAERDAAKAARPMREALVEWLGDVAARRKAGTHRNYTQAVERHFIPAFGSVPVNQLTTADVVKLHGRLQATPYGANHAVRALSAFCGWCEKRGYRPPRSNPCHGVEKYREQGRRRYLSADEYQHVGQAIRRARRAETISPVALTAIELLLLTGCRPAEVASLAWEHVDLVGAALNLPDSKTGQKTVHLSPAAVRLLMQWPRFAGSPYVFPGTGTRAKGGHIHHSTLSHAWQDLREEAGLADARLYDACRHSFASVGISQHRLGLAQVGELLGHTQAATTKRYAHLHDDVAKRNARAIGGTIAAALRGKKKASK